MKLKILNKDFHFLNFKFIINEFLIYILLIIKFLHFFKYNILNFYN